MALNGTTGASRAASVAALTAAAGAVACGAVGPKAVLQLFPRDNLARLLHESNEQLEWAVLETDADAVLAQFAGAYIHAKPAELESRN